MIKRFAESATPEGYKNLLNHFNQLGYRFFQQKRRLEILNFTGKNNLFFLRDYVCLHVCNVKIYFLNWQYSIWWICVALSNYSRYALSPKLHIAVV